MGFYVPIGGINRLPNTVEIRAPIGCARNICGLCESRTETTQAYQASDYRGG
jgi:hypothetical protein